jgi:hypothetical protein
MDKKLRIMKKAGGKIVGKDRVRFNRSRTLVAAAVRYIRSKGRDGPHPGTPLEQYIALHSDLVRWDGDRTLTVI